MSVFVDDMFKPFGRMSMCHMIADTHRELLWMADIIHVSHRWIQKAGTAFEHFDICKSKRQLAIAAGAIPIPEMELKSIIKKRARKALDERSRNES